MPGSSPSASRPCSAGFTSSTAALRFSCWRPSSWWTAGCSIAFFWSHTPMSLDHLRALEAHSLHVIETALAEVRKPCITCSFQAEGMVVLHMFRARRADVPVLFLDTVHHFAETYAYRDRIAKAWRLNLITLRAAEPSPGLWQVSTHACFPSHQMEARLSAVDGHDGRVYGVTDGPIAPRA